MDCLLFVFFFKFADNLLHPVTCYFRSDFADNLLHPVTCYYRSDTASADVSGLTHKQIL